MQAHRIRTLHTKGSRDPAGEGLETPHVATDELISIIQEATRTVRPASVMDAQVLLGDPKLTKLLIWEQQEDRVVAKPKHRLSRTAFQEIRRKFRKMGGGYSGYVGSQWNWRKRSEWRGWASPRSTSNGEPELARADFVTDALRTRCEELKILGPKPEPPALEHFNVNQDHVTVIDHKRRMFADVYFRNDHVYCELCEEEDCEHVKYVLSLSKVQKALERKGWVIGEGGRTIRKPD